MTVVAELDCITHVTKNPVNTPLTGLDVIFASSDLSPSPATFCSDSLMIFMP